eukprot:Selendium_serpulae@DN6226_c4_g3_i4.p1
MIQKAALLPILFVLLPVLLTNVLLYRYPEPVGQLLRFAELEFAPHRDDQLRLDAKLEMHEQDVRESAWSPRPEAGRALSVPHSEVRRRRDVRVEVEHGEQLVELAVF